MIFNTFDSDIKDATSALDVFKKKFGLFGKSLSQWGNIRSEWKGKINDIVKASVSDTDGKKAKRKAQKEAKNQVGSLYSYARKQRTENEVTSKFFVTKKSIQPFMQSGWFENFDNKKAQDILDKLKAQQDAIDKMGISTDSAKLKWEEYFETADESEKWQKTFVKDGKLVATNLDDITIGQENAAKAAKQHDKDLSNLTIGVKAANFAINAFKTALNAIAMWGIMELIQLAIKGIDQLANAALYASEAANEAYNKSKENADASKQEVQSLDELIQKYKDLRTSATWGTSIEERTEIANIQEEIVELVGSEANNLDLVNGKLDEQISKLAQIRNDKLKTNYENAESEYYTAVDAANKAVGSGKYAGHNTFDYVSKFLTKANNADEIKAGEILASKYRAAYFGNYINVDGEVNKTNLRSIDDQYHTSLEEIIGKTKTKEWHNGHFFIDLQEYKSAKEKVAVINEMIEELKKENLENTDIFNSLMTSRTNYNKFSTDEDNATANFVSAWLQQAQVYNKELSSMTVDSVNTFETYRRKMLSEAKSDTTIGNALKNGLLSEDDLEVAINTFMSTSNDFSKWYDEWINGFSDDSSSTQTGLGKLKQQREDLEKQISELNKKKQDLGKQSKLYTGLVEQGIGFVDPFGSSSQSPKIKNAFIKSLDDYSNALDDEISKIESNKTELDNQIASLESDLNFGKIWDSLDDTSDEDLKNFKSEILQLADAGQLTFYTFNQATGSDAFLKKIGIDAEAAIEKIERLSKLSTQLSSGNAQFSKMSDLLKESNENGYVSADSLTGFDDAVKNMPVWEEYERIMMDAASTAEQRQKITNALATEYFNTTDYFAKLTEENKGAYITQLKGWGVQNADEIVNNQLYKAAKDRKDALAASDEFLAEKSKEVGEATANEIHQFALARGYTEGVTAALDELALKKQLINGTELDFTKDLTAIIDYVEALGYSTEAMQEFQNAKDNKTKGSGSSAGMPTEAWEYLEDNAQGEFDDILAKIRAKINGTDNININPNGSKDSSSSSSSSNSDFDWIQTKLEVISRTTDKLQKKFEKTFTVNSAAKKFKDYLSQINSEISANKTAGQTYLNYFNGVGLSSEWKNKIKSGKYKIDKNVDSATADKISEAQGYWNNYLQTLETIDQLEDERESAEDTYANKVIDHYNKQIEKQQKLLDLREKFVSIRATWSDFANTASDYRYEQSKNMEQIKTYDNAIAKYRLLQKTVAQGSDAWNTYNEQIKDNQDKIQELTLSNAELSKSIMNLPLDNASKKIEKYSNNLSLLQTKYSSLNMADSKNKNIDLQQKQSANIKAANDAALREANANLNSAWAAIRTKDLKTINKNAKKGNYLIQMSDTREGYKAIIEYNNALTAQKKAYEEAEKASAEYYRTVQENTKTKWDNIINQYQTNYDYFNSKSSRASAYLDYRKSMGYSNTSIYQEDAYKDQLQAQKDALAELETERSKLDWNKIQKQYEAGELQRDDYFALAKTIKELDSSIYKAKSDINETNATINKIPFQRLEYQIGTLTNKQTELSNALSLKQKLNEAIKAEDYTSQINTNKQLEKLYISENEWLQEQLETVSVNSDKWKEWTDAIASNESKINSLKQSNEDLKDTLRSEVYIKPFEKMATKIDFLKERLSSFLGLVNDTDTMFDDKGAFTKNGEATLGLSLKNIDAAKLKIENIQNKIQEAQKLYNNGNNDIGYSEEEYADDMRQYISDMWNAVSESKSASDEIVKIYQEQGQAILDALNKEIDARSEALQKKKEYYDYDKTIKTKTKDIQSLETQIAAMQSMEDSLEKRKKLLELQEELNEKQEDLKDTQLDHQINIVVNGLDDFSTKIQENFDDSVKELKTNLDKQAEIINKANSLYADSYNSIFEHLSKLMKYYGIDSSKLPSDLKDTTIGNLKGFSRGGVARDLSGIIKQNGDSLLASINPNETVLTERFTELMPHAVDIMEGLIKTPVIPPSSVMQPNVNIQFNVDGNVDSVTWETIKKEIPNISKQVQKDIYVDLKKSGALRK